MRTLFLIGLLLAGAGAATYAVVRFTDPRPAYVHVRWNAAVDESARRGLERKYRLEQPQHTEGLTYVYALTDSSRTNVQALVEDQAVEDTQNIHRTKFRPGLFTPRLPYPTWVHAWTAGGLTFLSAVLLFVGGVAALLASASTSYAETDAGTYGCGRSTCRHLVDPLPGADRLFERSLPLLGTSFFISLLDATDRLERFSFRSRASRRGRAFSKSAFPRFSVSTE